MVPEMKRALLITALALMALYTAPAFAASECTCRFFGHSYKVGEQVCLKTPKGLRVANCGLELNNTSWKISDRACSVNTASLPQDKPLSKAALYALAERYAENKR